MKIIHNDVVRILDSGQDVSSVIKSLAAEDDREEAFYVCDLGDFVKKHNIWLKKFPRVKPHYAVKCNDSPEVLKTLAALGTGFDCASKIEIQKVLELGVHPNRIIYANPVKASSHLEYAKNNDIKVMTFDNEYELLKIKKIYPKSKLILRIRCDAAVSAISFGAKFGCDAINEAPKLLDIAKSLDLKVIGVSFHIGTDCGDSPAYYRGIAACRDVFDYANSTGHHLHVVDIGGGYPGNTGTSIDEIADTVNAALDEYFPDPNIDVIAEPGRFYVASAYTLACNVHSKRKVISSTNSKSMMYYINDGIFISFLSVYFENWKVKPIPLKEHSSELYPSTIWGPTCDSSDRVTENVMLPEMDIGEWLIFPNMGAYTIPLFTGFNAFVKPAIFVVANKETWNYLQDLLMDNKHFIPVETKEPMEETVIKKNYLNESLKENIFKIEKLFIESNQA